MMGHSFKNRTLSLAVSFGHTCPVEFYILASKMARRAEKRRPGSGPRLETDSILLHAVQFDNYVVTNPESDSISTKE